MPLSFVIVLARGVASSSLRSAPFMDRFGSLYLRYEDKFWWYETLVLLRRLLMVAVVVWAARYELVQAALLLLVLFFALLLQDAVRPYHDDAIDNFEFLQLISAHFILLCGIVYSSSQVAPII